MGGRRHEKPPVIKQLLLLHIDCCESMVDEAISKFDEIRFKCVDSCQLMFHKNCFQRNCGLDRRIRIQINFLSSIVIHLVRFNVIYLQVMTVRKCWWLITGHPHHEANLYSGLSPSHQTPFQVLGTKMPNDRSQPYPIFC